MTSRRLSVVKLFVHHKLALKSGSTVYFIFWSFTRSQVSSNRDLKSLAILVRRKPGAQKNREVGFLVNFLLVFFCLFGWLVVWLFGCLVVCLFVCFSLRLCGESICPTFFCSVQPNRYHFIDIQIQEALASNRATAVKNKIIFYVTFCYSEVCRFWRKIIFSIWAILPAVSSLGDFFRAKRLFPLWASLITSANAMPTKEKVASREKSRLVENGLKTKRQWLNHVVKEHNFLIIPLSGGEKRKIKTWKKKLNLLLIRNFHGW